MNERSLADSHGQVEVLLTLSSVPSRRPSYHSQADSAGSIPVTRPAHEKRCNRSESGVISRLGTAARRAAHVQLRSAGRTGVFALIGSAGHRQCLGKQSELDAAAVELSPNCQEVGHRQAETTGAADEQPVAYRQVKAGEAPWRFGALIAVRNLPAMSTPMRRTCS